MLLISRTLTAVDGIVGEEKGPRPRSKVPRSGMLPVAVGDRSFGVLVRIQYAAALDRWVWLGAFLYSQWLVRSRRYRTWLTVRPRPTYASLNTKGPPAGYASLKT